MKKVTCTSLLIFLAFSSFSQSLFTNTNFQKAVDKGTRTHTGLPGKNYWQNKANYNINISFLPATQLLTGSETIYYYNNSPDTLKTLVIRLYPDLYKKGIAPQIRIAEKDLNDGVQIDLLKMGNETISNFHDRDKAYHQNTNLFVKPERSVPPHDSLVLHINWHYQVNTGSQIRTGMVDSSSYFIAYFFPRIAVYDDIDGWDTWSYNGSQEFYNDFGNFDVSIRVPKEYVVWATGDRQNASDNFSENVLRKLAAAEKSDKIIRIIDSADYIKNDVLRGNASGIWNFHAQNVTDFAFALSSHYLWEASAVVVDSATGRRTLAEAAFNKVHKDYLDVANQARQTVFLSSHHYPKYPFPFSHITVFDGTDQMEYPMMCNDNPLESRKDAVQLTTHEIFHSYFPFFMGTNETQYSWMDEGWATIGESVLSPMMGEPEDEGIFSKTHFERISGSDEDIPLITNTKLYTGQANSANSYGKAGVSYYILQELLGDALFFKALHHYMDTWHGKHPTPYDFFYAINAGSGKDLNWFWKKWFFGWEYPEMSLHVDREKTGKTIIRVDNTGGLPLPVVLTLQFTDGKTLVKKYSPEIWRQQSGRFQVTWPALFKNLSRVTLGSEWIPDKYVRNNRWMHQ